MSPKIISIIPARGGSKGLPRKNIKVLCGKPLIAYTIEAALKSKYIEKTYVSTEDKEIAEISRNFGAEIINRPLELAKDDSPRRAVIKHAIESLRKKVKCHPDVIVYLQPTSPLRTFKDIDNAVNLFLDNKCDSVVSVCKSKESPYWSLKIKNEFVEPLFDWKYLTNPKRQDLPKSYILNGAIFLTTSNNFLKCNSLINNRTLPYIMPIWKSVDIDDKVDIKLVEFLLKEKNEK